MFNTKAKVFSQRILALKQMLVWFLFNDGTKILLALLNVK